MEKSALKSCICKSHGAIFAHITTSFPGSSLFLLRGRKREDPGNEVEHINVRCNVRIDRLVRPSLRRERTEKDVANFLKAVLDVFSSLGLREFRFVLINFCLNNVNLDMIV